MRRFFLILLVLKLVCFSDSAAQIPEFKFRQLPNLEKLSSRSVTCMAQDSTGFIWIGTDDGLNRFNGYEFEVYRSQGQTPTGLTSNEISSIFVDSKNRIWVGTQFGISVFNAAKNNFIPIASPEDPGGLTEIYITGITEDRTGKIIVSAGNSIYFLDEELLKFKLKIESTEGLITSLFIDQSNAIWVGHENGHILYFTDNKFLSVTNFDADINTEIGPDAAPVTGLIVIKNFLWIGYRGGGIVKYDLNTKTKKHYLTGSAERFVMLLYKDQRQRLWSCDYTGLKLYNELDDHFFGYYHNAAELNSIRPNLTGIFLDKQGNYFFFYRGEGVYVSYVDRGFKQFDTSPLWYWYVQSANIMAVSEEANGNLWLGGYNGGIDVFDWINGRMIRFNTYQQASIRLGMGTIFAIYRDSDDLMWIGSHSGGLRSYNTETGELRIYQHVVDDPESIIGNDVRSISEDKFGNIWVGVHGKGVSKFNKAVKNFKHYTVENNGLPSIWVEPVLADSRGNTWVGSTGGLSLLKNGEDVFKNFYATPEQNDGLQGNRVICIHESRKGMIWVGTNEGLYMITPDSLKITRFAESAYNQYITGIEEDHNGKIWFSTLAGLYRLDTETGTFFQFNENDGLQGSGFNHRASFYNGKTELFFGGTKGVNLFNPDNLHFNTTKPTIVFSRFLLFNKEIVDYRPGGILEKHISKLDEVILNYDQNVFTIEFTALNMINPERNTYAYILDGFDSRWNYIGSKRDVTYTNLNPGRYTFRVKAANNDGVWNDDGISLRITVLPPWYRTNLFYFLLVVMAVALPFLFSRLRTVALRRQKKHLSHMVAEKTWKLRKNNESLKQRTVELNRINFILEERQQTIEQQSLELEMQALSLQKTNNELSKLNNTKDKLFSIIAHDLRAPFNTILGFSGLLIDINDRDDLEKVSVHARYVHDASLQVYNLLENLLFWARSQTNEIHCNPIITDLNQIVDDNLDLLKESFVKKELEILTDGYENYPVCVDLDMMRTVVRNLLINAIKFTPKGGSVSLKAKKIKSLVKLSISDTGVGIHKDDMQLLTIAGEQKTTKGTEGERGSGLGLVLCNEFTVRNGGRLIIESELGQGSTFSILLPQK